MHVRLPARAFISYSREDETFRQEFEVHLSLLKRQGVIECWHDRQITPGAEWREAVDRHLEEADVILLLISAHFLAYDHTYNNEMRRALERHTAGEALVMPIYLRSADYQGAPFTRLSGFPQNGRPITNWSDPHEAWADVVRSLRQALTGGAVKRDVAIAGGPTETTGEWTPAYPDESIQRLSDDLLSAYGRKEALVAMGEATTDLDSEILELRRQLRRLIKINSSTTADAVAIHSSNRPETHA